MSMISEDVWVCVVCEEDFKPEWKGKQKSDWTCVDCAYHMDVIRWGEMICPIMNRYTTRKKMIRCQTAICPSFQRSHRRAYCKIIDREYNYPELIIRCKYNV